MNNSATTTTHPRNRGIAMPLVLISIAIAVVIAGVALSSRDTTSAIGENAANTAKAKWAAESAANLATAVVEQNIADWTDSVDSNLMTNVDLAGADVSVQIVNKDGLAPTPTDEELTMTIRATTDGITREITKEIVVTQPVDLSGAIDPMLSEFAIYATEKIDITNNAMVRVWPGAPRANTLFWTNIGGEFASILDVNIDPTAKLYNVRFYPTTNSASTVQDLTADQTFDDGDPIPFTIPLYSTPWTIGMLLRPDMGDVLITGPGTVITLDAATDPQVRMNSLTISNGAKLVISGNVEMYVHDDINIDNASLVFENHGASLTVFTGHQVNILNESLVGVHDGLTRETALTQNHHAEHLKVIVRDETLQSGHSSPSIVVDNSLLCAELRAARADTHFQNTSIFIGRVTAKRVAIDNSMFLYDPEMNTTSGFTNLSGPCYDQVTLQPVDGLQAALDSYSWVLGENYFSTYLNLQVADDPDAGDSGGVQVMDDLEGSYTTVFENTTFK